MFHPLSIIISFGAFLLLLMPTTGAGMVLTAAALAIGICLIAYKKAHQVAFRNNKQYFLIPVAMLIVAPYGQGFYDRWLSSSNLQAVAALLPMSIELLLLIASLILSGLSVYFLYAVLQVIVKKISDPNPQNDFARGLVACIYVSVVTVLLAQIMVGANALSMGNEKFMWGILIVSVAILFMYCLFGRIIPSVVFGAGLFMVISTINVYVYNFRGRLFEPVDVFSAGTAMNVAENYSLLPIPFGALIGWLFFAVVLIALYRLQHQTKRKLALQKRFVSLIICVIGSVAIFDYTTNLKTYHWEREGAINNGYILDFVSKLKEITPPKPDNYSIELVDRLADQYAAYQNNASQTELSKPPHIIVIMDEAFSDLRVVGQFTTNTEVMPFISSLKENTVSGYALASVYGGNTANSEYEFLTGNSLAWLSPNAVPYQQYLRTSSYSMVSYLKSAYHYKCVAMHPFQANGWNRPVAYQHLGFDACHFIEDFPQKHFIRSFVSDREMFEVLIKTFEAQKEESPLFLFGVTMQNHGSYTYRGKNYRQRISVERYGDKYPELEQYLSLIYETDKAVKYLIRYFQNADENVVIVFFGDHQPKINESFYEAVSGTTADTLDEQQKRYTIPFFIWANFDIEEQTIARTSLNYLSSYVYQAAGIPLPTYNKFLQQMEKTIPAINANGFYSPSAGCYLPLEEASQEERKWLQSYEALQYNSIFDTAHRNEAFFPTLE